MEDLILLAMFFSASQRNTVVAVVIDRHLLSQKSSTFSEHADRKKSIPAPNQFQARINPWLRGTVHWLYSILERHSQRTGEC